MRRAWGLSLSLVALAAGLSAAGYKLSTVEREAPAATRATLERARGVIGSAITRGTWTLEDRAAVRRELRGLSASERAALMGELFPAVNRGALKPEFRGPLI